MAMNTSSHEYFDISNDKCQNWDNEWSESLTSWTANGNLDIPIWQYASVQDHDLAYFSPPSTSPTMPYSLPSISHDSLAPPSASVYPPRSIPSSQPSPYMESADGDEDEDSDAYSWGPGTPATSEHSGGKLNPHKRGKSEGKLRAKDAKRAHTVVERNYRERLNDKIADLGLYLFETSADSRTRPSKSLVMTRAKERLQQLESRNKSLEAEVTKLRQHIAILEHVGGKERC